MSSVEPLVLTLYGADATRDLGRRIGSACRGGELLLLSGDLGAGKTTLVQGLAEGLGVSPRTPVTSPTFVLHARYTGRLQLEHIDGYRLEGLPHLAELGFEEFVHAPGGVTAVEWPGRVRGLDPARALRIEIRSPASAVRVFRLTTEDPEHRLVLKHLGMPAEGAAPEPDPDR